MPLSKDKEPPRIIMISSASSIIQREEQHRVDTESRWQAQAAQLSEEAKKKLINQVENIQPYDETYLYIISGSKYGIDTETLKEDFLADVCNPDFPKERAVQIFLSIDADFRTKGWVVDGQFPQNLEGGRFKIEEGRHIKPEFYSPLREILMQRRQGRFSQFDK